MKAKEIIAELQQVAPDTEVTIATSEGTRSIERVARLGYTDKVCQLVADD